MSVKETLFTLNILEGASRNSSGIASWGSMTCHDGVGSSRSLRSSRVVEGSAVERASHQRLNICISCLLSFLKCECLPDTVQQWWCVAVVLKPSCAWKASGGFVAKAQFPCPPSCWWSRNLTVRTTGRGYQWTKNHSHTQFKAYKSIRVIFL